MQTNQLLQADASGSASMAVMNITDFNQRTPWGMPELFVPVADGIMFISTASHGGYHLTPVMLDRVPTAWRMARKKNHDTLSSPWFEEDVDWCLVALSFPEAFPPDARIDASLIFQAFFAPRGLTK